MDLKNIKNGKLFIANCLNVLKNMPTNAIDLIVTDPPYGLSFMGKNWDKALPDIEIFEECLRVLKPGAFAFVMAAPRQDVLSRMMIMLEDVGFKTDFTSIYWTYATGFTKAHNIGKTIDKKLGKEREVIGTRKQHDIRCNGYPAIYINTTETDRAVKSIHADGYESFAWDCLRGVISPETNRIVEDIIDPMGALNWLSGRQETILIGQNFHHFLGSIEIIQSIANNIHIYKGQGSCLAIAGPHLTLPPEIEKYFTVLDFALPSTKDLADIMKELGDAVGIDINPEAVEAAKGLTEFEAETAFALSLVKTKTFDPVIITGQKKMMIRRTGLMEFFPPVPMDQVGGLEPFKQYLMNRIKAFEPGNEHLPKPKALLLVGIPGTGKSLACKAAASILNWPLIRLDISALKGSLVGESEKKMRQANLSI